MLPSAQTHSPLTLPFPCCVVRPAHYLGIEGAPSQRIPSNMCLGPLHPVFSECREKGHFRTCIMKDEGMRLRYAVAKYRILGKHEAALSVHCRTFWVGGLLKHS